MSKRDPDRTAQKILEAAFTEFADKGFAGARVDEIAKVSGVNKRMIYYYFQNKEGLYEAILKMTFASKREAARQAPTDPLELLEHYTNTAFHDRDFIRLLQWEALGWEHRPVIDEEERRKTFLVTREKLIKMHEMGIIPEELEPKFIQFVYVAMTWFPTAFPQLARMITDGDSSTEEYQKDYLDFLHKLTCKIISLPE